MIKLSDIEASLEYGKFYTKDYVVFFYFGLVTAALLLLLAIIIITATLAGCMEWNQDMLFVLVFMVVFGTALLILFAHLTILNNRHKKKIELWLSDAVLLKAYCKKLDEVWSHRQPRLVKI